MVCGDLAEPGRQPLLDRSIGRMDSARRIVAVGGGEEGNAGVADRIDPEARTDAIGIAGMTPHGACTAEQIVMAARLRDRQALHGETIGAVETVLIGAVA